MASGAVERRIVSVMFCDLVGFTSLSESMDAEDVAIVQDAYFAAVREAVARYGGRLEKFIGDAAVAVFGTPGTRDDDAERAVRCGFAIVGSVEQVCARLGLEPGTLRVRVGVNTGEAVVHPEAGPGDAVVTGDTVNTAARLQSAAEPDAVLVGGTTALAIADAVETEDGGALDLKGKAEPVPAFRAVAIRPERSRDAAMGGLRAPMLGRDVELASLLEALDAAATGGSGRTTIVAPPGVGKTRLTSEFAAIATARGASVRRARLRPDVLAPYGAVAELLAAAAADHGADPDRDVVERVLTTALRERGLADARIEVIVADALGVTWPDRARTAAPSPEQRDALFASWRAALAALGHGPEVWLVEDVHWAGGDLLAFLGGDVADDPDDAGGRLVVATARPSLLETAPDWVSAAATIELAPLPSADAADLVRALVGDAIPADLVRKIAERSDGNALFIEELLRTWISTGVLEPEGAGWRLTAAPDHVALPETVQAIYGAQLDDLPRSARGTARAASVAGRRFPSDALEALDPGAHAEGLAVLERRALISGPTPDASLGGTWSFRHALLRDAGYASLARAERARLHVRMARWLEGAAGDRAHQVAEVIGRHYAAAVSSAPALADEIDVDITRDDGASLAAAWFERGADAARTVAAHDATAELLRRSIELTEPGDLVARARRQVALAGAIAFVVDIEEALALVLEAAGALRDGLRARPDDDAGRTVYADATWVRCRILAQQIRFEEIVDVAEAALADLGGDDAAVARVLVARGLGHTMIGESAMREHETGTFQRVLAAATATGDRELELDARMWLSLDDDGEAGWRRIAELSHQLGRLDAEGQALQILTGLTLPDDPALGLRRLEDHRTFGVAHGLTEESAWADYRESELRFHLGEWDEAMAAAGRAVDVGIANAYHRVTVRSWHVATMIADARDDRGTLERAVGWYEGFRSAGSPDTPYGRLSQTQVDLIFARHGLGRAPSPTFEHLAVSLGEEQVLPSWFAGVDLVVSHWVDEARIEDAEAAAGAFAPSPDAARGAFGDAVAELLLARVAGAHGDVDGAIVHAEAALGGFRRIGTPWWVAKALRVQERAEPDHDRRAEVEAIERELALATPAP